MFSMSYLKVLFFVVVVEDKGIVHITINVRPKPLPEDSVKPDNPEL